MELKFLLLAFFLGALGSSDALRLMPDHGVGQGSRQGDTDKEGEGIHEVVRIQDQIEFLNALQAEYVDGKWGTVGAFMDSGLPKDVVKVFEPLESKVLNSENAQATIESLANELGLKPPRVASASAAANNVSNDMLEDEASVLLPSAAEYMTAHKGSMTEPIDPETSHSEHAHQQVGTELGVAVASKDRREIITEIVIAVAPEGQSMQFRDPDSKQLVSVTVPDGVQRGESFQVTLLPPVDRTAKIQVLNVSAFDSSTVFLGKPVKATGGKRLNKMTVGDPERGEALIPGLVPVLGSKASWDLTEERNFEGNPLIEKGKYFAVADPDIGRVINFETSYGSLTFGRIVVKAFDSTDTRLFTMRMPRNSWNFGRWTWRLTTQKSSKDLFTIKKAIINDGSFLSKEKWYIYRGKPGTKKHNKSWFTPNLMYFCRSDHIIVGDPKVIKCFKSKRDFDAVHREKVSVNEGLAKRKAEGVPWKNKTKAEKQTILKWKREQDEIVKAMLGKITVATLVQKPNVGVYLNSWESYVPDEYTLTVAGGEDSAVFMAWATLCDIKDEWVPKREALIKGVLGLVISKQVMPYFAGTKSIR